MRSAITVQREQANLRARGYKGPLLAISYLAISSGGENGAFGEVVLLRDIQGWGAAEICGLLGITECNRRGAPSPGAFAHPRRVGAPFRRLTKEW
jgi:hypothetical protein